MFKKGFFRQYVHFPICLLQESADMVYRILLMSAYVRFSCCLLQEAADMVYRILLLSAASRV